MTNSFYSPMKTWVRSDCSRRAMPREAVAESKTADRLVNKKKIKIMVEPHHPIPDHHQQKPWWESFFDEVYGQDVLDRLDEEKTKAQVDFIFRELNLKPGQSVFDQCCGRGRLSIPIATQGCHVTGVDCIDTYISRASHKSRESQLACEFICDDARQFVMPELCDVVINWFTSFGYSADDADNIKLLQRAYESLKPGGMFALDYVNMAYVIKNFQDRHVHIDGPDCSNSLVVIEESEVDCVAGMLKSHWNFFLPDGKRTRRLMKVKIYMPYEISSLLQNCGFEEIRLFGNVLSDPITLETPRCICVGRKPA